MTGAATWRRWSLAVLTVAALPVPGLCLAAGGHVAGPTSPATSVQVATLDDGLADGSNTDRLSLPRPLSADDAAIYRRLFALQDERRYGVVDRLAQLVDNRILLGHLLAERYLDHPDYKTSFAELAEWLSLYGDQPDAERIYALARKRRPAGAAVPRPLNVAATTPAAVEDGQSYVSPLRRPKSVKRKVAAWRRHIPALLRQGDLDEAQAALADPAIAPLLDHAEFDIARWQVGRALLTDGRPDRAYPLTGPAAFRSVAVLPAMAWTAGLNAWRVKDYAGAQRFFSEFLNHSGDVPADAAMAAFWAARASLAANHPQFVGRFMRLAAATGDSFYGRLAKAVLGDAVPAASIRPDLTGRSIATLLKYAAGRRALALEQIGRTDLAEDEIATLARRQDDPALNDAIWNLTEALELPPETAAAMSFAAIGLPAARYPVPKLKTSRFTLDRALVLAVIKAESGFDQLATSAAGARGLMQIMPETAAAVALRNGSEFDAADLHDPLVNLKLGQGYLKLLMARKEIGANLIYLAAAYNAGPGRIIQWTARDPGIDDPLYFLESIPLIETRAYVKNVLSAYWVYQERFKEDATSLDELRLGVWPMYREPGAKLQTASSE